MREPVKVGSLPLLAATTMAIGLLLCMAQQPALAAERTATTSLSVDYVDEPTPVCPLPDDAAAASGMESTGGGEEIAGEQPNGVAEIVYHWYTDAEVAKTSYATADVNGCSATMIGPNVIMMAGHCTQVARNATFRVYTDANTRVTEAFACQYLLHTWPDTDLNLYWCDANAAGENPGDKYGYLDFDVDIDPATDSFGSSQYATSKAKLAVGNGVYSIWTNPITSLGAGNYSIYSKGTITSLGYTSWHTPNLSGTDYLCGNSGCVGGANPGQNCEGAACGVACNGGTCTARISRGVGAGSNVWSAPGASGSAQLGMNSNRIQIGPLSVGSGPEGPSRSAIPIADVLYWDITDANATAAGCMPCIPDQLNIALLGTLGLASPAGYYGYVDGDLDGRFDVQHDLELLRGETARDWYWLGFESHRRNGLWTRHEAASSEISSNNELDSYTILDTRARLADDYALALSHERLNLPWGRLYHVRFRSNITHVIHDKPIKICLEGSNVHCADTVPAAVGQWETYVVNLWASDNADLNIYLKNGTRMIMKELSIIADGTRMTFDSHDQRYSWRNANNGERAVIWPNGRNAPGAIDWAGVVTRNQAMPLTEDWPLANSQLPFDAGAEYRVCFEMSRSSREAWSPGMLGAVGVFDSSGVNTNSLGLFGIPANGWVAYCTYWFPVDTDDNTLRFGVSASQASDSGTYLVDNIDIQKRGASPVYVDQANTGFEDGSITYPYSTINEGASAVDSQGTVLIQSYTYPESLVIERAMELDTIGGSVLIGR